MDKLIPFKRPEKPSYLSACRDQGVHQEREELLAEHAELLDERRRMAAEAAQRRIEMEARIGGNAPSGHLPVDHPRFADRAGQAKAETLARVDAILEAFERLGHGGPWLSSLRLLICQTDMSPEWIATYIHIAEHSSLSMSEEKEEKL
ncbi:hypothetical protein IGS74_18870 [Aureimonas sp. OT7]|uniref:hypothetical protein n=1 Tax=Aureimonas sp. OT7 TaxID=2816454 RepID=UPI0017866926|nr:hypothetical protein [Aureimonas sp. OT7]QOG06545.1 hypothetical protein IGS74_18870 [Aureimonas sp. OT7]